MNWSDYRRVTENVPAEDGGGYRIYYPTLGYAVYGVGDTIEEAYAGLADSQAAFEQFVDETPEYEPPGPSRSDMLAAEASCESNNNQYAYAA